LQYFTGDRRHNILLRERAIHQGYKLNEYGLFSAKGGSASGGKNGKLVPVPTEDDIYRILGLKTPPPEKRLGKGEFKAR
ncbi:MAG: DNA polymerase/3'-5' exonuclease PolX, partial [Candidatus Uhrbacteria bacterium]|nr:DNA polymerase/3'-5' exonuclease PolX [Candidatus Uhrbacteria bacterium]